MQPEDQNDGVQLPTRYQCYMFAKRHLRGTSRPEVFPIGCDSGEDASVCERKIQTAQTINTSIARNQSDGQYINVVGTLEEDGWEKRHEQIRRVHGTDGISPTIPTGTGGGVMTKIETDAKIRRLTPVECERLQGFPDNWTEGISDSQRYKCCGNAVTTNVITAIMERLL